MSQLKVAVVGTNIGSTLHVRSLKAAGFAVTTLVGRDAARTSERAAHFNIPIAVTSVEQAIDSDIDAIVVATPPESHVPLALAAMRAGKHVLCEKPLALTADLARELRDAAAASGVVTALQHQQRWVPAHAMLRKQVGQGAFGELIQGSFISQMQKWTSAYIPPAGSPMPGMKVEDFAAIKTPVLIMQNGANDLAHTPATTEWVHRLIPHSKLVPAPWGDDEWNERSAARNSGAAPGLFVNWPKLAPQILDFIKQ